MKCAFVVGQKVVCVHGWEPIHHIAARMEGITLPVVGAVYTVRWIGEMIGEVVIQLEEIINPVMQYDIGVFEQGFSAARFRPLIKRPTDISIFKAMLTPAGKVPADA